MRRRRNRRRSYHQRVPKSPLQRSEWAPPLCNAAASVCNPVVTPFVSHPISVNFRLLEFRAAMAAVSAAKASLSEDALLSALAGAARLQLSGHPTPAVRDEVASAAELLGRIQRAKAGLAAAIRSLDAATLESALDFAATVPYESPLVGGASAAAPIRGAA
jgi:hypothetical protein